MTPSEIAQKVAAAWPDMCSGGSWCPNMTARLCGALEAAGYDPIALDMENKVDRDDPRDFHYAVWLDGMVYDLTYKQFDPSTPVPYIRPMSEVEQDFRDVRVKHTGPDDTWWQGQMDLGRALMKPNGLREWMDIVSKS